MSGLGGFSAGWARIAPAVAGTTRVCASDRAGRGWSEDVSDPQDGLAATSVHAIGDVVQAVRTGGPLPTG
jgi:hypothetical protein